MLLVLLHRPRTCNPGSAVKSLAELRSQVQANVRIRAQSGCRLGHCSARCKLKQWHRVAPVTRVSVDQLLANIVSQCMGVRGPAGLPCWSPLVLPWNVALYGVVDFTYQMHTQKNRPGRLIRPYIIIMSTAGLGYCVMISVGVVADGTRKRDL